MFPNEARAARFCSEYSVIRSAIGICFQMAADASATSFSPVVMWDCGGLLCSASFCQWGALRLKCDGVCP